MCVGTDRHVSSYLGDWSLTCLTFIKKSAYKGQGTCLCVRATGSRGLNNGAPSYHIGQTRSKLPRLRVGAASCKLPSACTAALHWQPAGASVAAPRWKPPFLATSCRLDQLLLPQTFLLLI